MLEITYKSWKAVQESPGIYAVYYGSFHMGQYYVNNPEQIKGGMFHPLPHMAFTIGLLNGVVMLIESIEAYEYRKK